MDEQEIAQVAQEWIASRKRSSHSPILIARHSLNITKLPSCVIDHLIVTNQLTTAEFDVLNLFSRREERTDAS